MMELPASKTVFILGFFLMRFQSVSPLYTSCPPGWVTWHQSCYILLPEKMTWYEASAACSRPGSSLAAPNTREENDFIWHSFGVETTGMWIGCTDAAEEGVWLCGDQPAKFTYWYSNNPKDDIQLNCARMTVAGTGGIWSDSVACDSTNRKSAACELTAASKARVYHTTLTGPDGRVPQQCLHHHDITNLTAEGVVSCGWACLADPRCRSFNLWQSSKREKRCQLNDVTRIQADSTDFKTADGCYYFDL